MSILSAYATRPEPAEPWRYLCPECGSPQLRERACKSGERYDCGDCNSYLSRDDLVDQRGEQ